VHQTRGEYVEGGNVPLSPRPSGVPACELRGLGDTIIECYGKIIREIFLRRRPRRRRQQRDSDRCRKTLLLCTGWRHNNAQASSIAVMMSKWVSDTSE